MVGMVTGILIENVLTLRWSGLLSRIPWTWFRTRDPEERIYLVVANALHRTAMVPELRQYFALKAEDKIPDSAGVADLSGKGSMWRIVRSFGICTLIGRVSGSK